jgi:hypothetical protein
MQQHLNSKRHVVESNRSEKDPRGEKTMEFRGDARL